MACPAPPHRIAPDLAVEKNTQDRSRRQSAAPRRARAEYTRRHSFDRPRSYLVPTRPASPASLKRFFYFLFFFYVYTLSFPVTGGRKTSHLLHVHVPEPGYTPRIGKIPHDPPAQTAHTGNYFSPPRLWPVTAVKPTAAIHKKARAKTPDTAPV